jgi:hypothetical protein
MDQARTGSIPHKRLSCSIFWTVAVASANHPSVVNGLDREDRNPKPVVSGARPEPENAT